MGCPDWPKCFGGLVPPTSESQLPPDYKEFYIEKRLAKNEKLAQLLKKVGFGHTAEIILNDPAVRQHTPFNLTKAWIEYANRLLGVLLGPLLLALCVTAYQNRHVLPGLFPLAIGTLLVTLFQGWLGSIVVSTHLLPGTITVHMLLALLIVFLLIKMLSAFYPSAGTASFSAKFWVLLAIALSLLQIVFGTEVRKEIDQISYKANYHHRETWIDEMGVLFYVHRSFSLVVLFLNAYIIATINGLRFREIPARFTKMPLTHRALLSLIVIEIFSGVVLTYAGFPAFMQPVHLLMASAIFGVQCLVLFQFKENRV